MPMTATSFHRVAPFLLACVVPLAACASSSAQEGDPGEGDVGSVESALLPGPGVPITPGVPGGPLTLRPRSFKGTFQCLGQPLAELPFTLAGRPVVTGADGRFELFGSVGTTMTQDFQISFSGSVTSSGVTTPLRIVDELRNARGETRRFTGTWGSATGGGVAIDFGTVDLNNLDCELYRLGRLVLRDFHATRSAQPPDRALEIKRMSDVHFGTPHTFYDHIVIRTNWLHGTTPDSRHNTLFHEFGHSLRHVADGPEHHWNWDNFRWAYARNHSGVEIFNTQYAFNEGWASFWAATRSDLTTPTVYAEPVPATDPRNVHFVENMIANRLVADSQLPHSSRRIMMEVLEENPGSIHSLHEFETRLFARIGMKSLPPAPPACPIGWTDDGATCRTGGEVVAKTSYGRGVGTVPTACGPGNTYDPGGLCYPACRANFDQAGPLCIEDCPAGYNDDGLFCRRDAHIFGSNNSACPGYDLCGLTFARGCSTCPAGYENDGCTCRRDAHIFPKNSYGRGVGWVPTACAGGKVYQDGLCYDACRAGWSSAGPVCYSPCPAGFEDDGALCRRPLAILVKY